MSEIKKLHQFVEDTKITPEKFNLKFRSITSPIKRPTHLVHLVKRPELDLKGILKVISDNPFSPAAVQEVEFALKYDGYIKRNEDLIKRFRQHEEKIIPDNFEYSAIQALSVEAREKLSRIRPESFGQASRISGVSPADLSVLLIHLERYKYHRAVSRETINKP